MKDLQALLLEIVSLLRTYVVLPKYAAETIALYVFNTWLTDIATFAPLLLLKSPEMRCGKTTLMDLIGELVREPLAAVNASPAALFRAISARQPTLMLDEVDAFLSMKNETSEAIRGILNAGHRRGRFSRIIRTSGDNFDIAEFDVFGPKVLSGIGNIHSTLSDRSIIVPMRRKAPEETVQRLRIARLEPKTEELRQRCEALANETRESLEIANPDIPVSLSDRAADNWELLIAIADLACGDWPQIARNCAITLSTMDTKESPREALLKDIRSFFDEHSTLIAVSSVMLLNYLCDIETRPWSSWHRDKEMTPRDLAKQLEPFGIAPLKISIDGQKIRGYRKDDFKDTWDRYLKISGTMEPERDISLTENKLDEFHIKEQFRNHKELQMKSSASIRNPDPNWNPVNSLQNNHLRAVSTGVPDNSGRDINHSLENKLEIF